MRGGSHGFAQAAVNHGGQPIHHSRAVSACQVGDQSVAAAHGLADALIAEQQPEARALQ
jgi:hypothetical protein